MGEGGLMDEDCDPVKIEGNPQIIPITFDGPLKDWDAGLRMLNCKNSREGFSIEVKAGFSFESILIENGITHLKIKRQRGRPWMHQKGGKLERWQEANRKLT